MNTTDTAYWTAACRALESSRPDSIFSDYLAAQLAGDRGERFIRDIPGAEDVAWSVVVRTKIIDDILIRMMWTGEIDAVLNLGAGLDTRPYRMSMPSTVTWIEADLPELVKVKNAVLDNVRRYSVDLTGNVARVEMLARVSAEFQRVLVLTEGLLPYLTESQSMDLAFSFLHRSEYAWWLTDVISPEHARRSERVLGRAAGEPVKLTTLGVDFFINWGWRESEYHSLHQTAMRTGRGARFPERRWTVFDRYNESHAQIQCQPQRTSGVLLLKSSANG